MDDVWPYSDIRCIWAVSCNTCRDSRSRTSAPSPSDRSQHWWCTAPDFWMTRSIAVAVAGAAIGDALTARTDTTPRPSHPIGPVVGPIRQTQRWISPSFCPARRHLCGRNHFSPVLEMRLFMVPPCLCQLLWSLCQTLTLFFADRDSRD